MYSTSTCSTCVELVTLFMGLDQRLARLKIQRSVMGCFNRTRSNISKYMDIFHIKNVLFLLETLIWAPHKVFYKKASPGFLVNLYTNRVTPNWVQVVVSPLLGMSNEAEGNDISQTNNFVDAVRECRKNIRHSARCKFDRFPNICKPKIESLWLAFALWESSVPSRLWTFHSKSVKKIFSFY